MNSNIEDFEGPLNTFLVLCMCTLQALFLVDQEKKKRNKQADPPKVSSNTIHFSMVWHGSFFSSFQTPSRRHSLSHKTNVKTCRVQYCKQHTIEFNFIRTQPILYKKHFLKVVAAGKARTQKNRASLAAEAEGVSNVFSISCGWNVSPQKTLFSSHVLSKRLSSTNVKI